MHCFTQYTRTPMFCCLLGCENRWSLPNTPPGYWALCTLLSYDSAPFLSCGKFPSGVRQGPVIDSHLSGPCPRGPCGAGGLLDLPLVPLAWPRAACAASAGRAGGSWFFNSQPLTTGAIPRSSRDGPARTRRACSEMASSVARGGLPAAVCCARTCARGWCGGAGVPRLPPAAPSSLARAMDLLGRGGPAPRWRTRSLEAGLLRLRAAHLRTHVRKHARTWVVLWCVAWGMGRDVACTAAVERERGGMEAPPVGWGRAPRTRDGGLSVRSWFLGSAPAAPAKYPTRIQPPRWRDVARAAAMERERGDMETSAVGWGRAPRTRDGGLSVRSWSLGSAPAAPAKCHIPNSGGETPIMVGGLLDVS